jgi:serine/threonine protein kinase
MDDLSRLSPSQSLVVVRTMLLSIRLLHQAGFVHGDLKPENIVIQESRPGTFVAKVIDFDDGYIVGLPPGREEVVGDQRFYSPELMMYIKGNPMVTGDMLTTASDMFALGLLLHYMFACRLPHFDRDKYRWAAEAAVHEELNIDGVGGPLKAWIEMLTSLDYEKRPLIDDLLYFFIELSPDELAECLFAQARPAQPRITRATGLKGTLSAKDS